MKAREHSWHQECCPDITGALSALSLILQCTSGNTFSCVGCVQLSLWTPMLQNQNTKYCSSLMSGGHHSQPVRLTSTCCCKTPGDNVCLFKVTTSFFIVQKIKCSFSSDRLLLFTSSCASKICYYSRGKQMQQSPATHNKCIKEFNSMKQEEFFLHWL